MAHPESLDAAGFDPEVLAQHAQFVRRLARGLVRDGDAAEELTARTFAAAVEKKPDTGREFQGWLRRVTWRLFVRDRRERERRDRREHGAASPESTGPTVDLVAALELQRRIARAFEEVAEPSKSALYLRYFLDLGPAEIAVQFGVPVATVKSRLKRGLESLRERMDAASGGRRDAWMQALIPWIGGPVMVATKSKGVAIAMAAVVLIGIGIGGFEAWRRSSAPHAAPAHAEAATATASSSAATKGAAAPPLEVPPTRAAVEPAGRDPFATGVVVDEAGAPLAGVTIAMTRLFRPKDSPGRQLSQEALRLDRLERDRVATTDVRGRFVVDEPLPDSASFVFLKDGFASEEWFDLAADRAKNRDHRVVLRAAAGLRGRVLDREHRPVEFVRATVWPHEVFVPYDGFPVAAHLADAPRYYPNPGCQLTTTNSDGVVAFSSFARPDFQLDLMAAGYANFDAVSATLVAPYEITLVRNSLHLDVVDADSGAPLRAALLVTDGEGRILDRSVPWVPADVDRSVASPEGRLFVHTGFGSTGGDAAPRWLLEAKDGRLDIELHVVAAGHVGEIVDAAVSKFEEPPHLRVQLAPAGSAPRDAVLDGRVLGAKHAELGVCCLIPGHGEPLHEANETLLVVEAGDDGHFELFDLPAARYRLFVRAPGVAPTSVDVDAPSHDVTIELKPAASLDVVVRTHAGAAAANVIVHAQRPDRSRAWHAKTGPDGVAFLEGILAGPLVVGAFEDLRQSLSDPSVCFPIDASAFTDSTVVDVRSGERTRVERMLVERVATRFHFERDDHATIRQLKCEIDVSKGPAIARFGELSRLQEFAPGLDANGDVTIDLDPGRYEIRVSDGGPTRSTPVAIPADRTPIPVRVPALRETGTLLGRVVDSVTGRPVVKRKVLVSWRSEEAKELRPEVRLTDDDGRFRFDGQPVGPTLVRVQGDARGDATRFVQPDPSSPYTYASQECTVENGRETVLEFTMVPLNAKDAKFPTLEADVRVTEASTGRPIERARIYVHAFVGATEVEVASLETDAGGGVRSPVFAADRYSVEIYGPALRRDEKGPAYVRLVVPASPADGVLTVEAALATTH